MSAALATSVVIVPTPLDAAAVSFRTGGLSHISEAQITERLGFHPTRDSAEGQSDQEWRFRVDEHDCSIWDFQGSGRNLVWSTYGPAEIFSAIFGWRAGR